MEKLNELALFAGAGGGILGGHLLGWRTVCAVEWEQYPACVLAARQNDGLLPPFPIWDDVQTFDGKPWRGIVDVISGGFPCQDISAAGKGAGIEGERSGMWREMARIIGEVRPKFTFIENSPMLVNRGLGTVLADLAKLGFDAEWGVLGAADVGAKHQRDRIWIVAKQRELLSHSDNRDFRGEQQSQSPSQTPRKSGNVANANNSFRGWERWGVWSDKNSQSKWDLHSIFNQPEPIRMADGVAARAVSYTHLRAHETLS
jgi:DNA (cytosine-5)-methyltransferase 1